MELPAPATANAGASAAVQQMESLQEPVKRTQGSAATQREHPVAAALTALRFAAEKPLQPAAKETLIILQSVRHQPEAVAVLSKRAVESEGVRFNWQSVAMLIVFLVVLALLLWWLVPRIGSGKFNATVSDFGKNIWDIRTGGVE